VFYKKFDLSVLTIRLGGFVAGWFIMNGLWGW
jgi:hypothetical protein